MSWWDALLSFVIGCIGALTGVLIWRAGTATKKWIRHRESFERTIDLAQRLVRATAEVKLLEIALQRECEEHDPIQKHKFVQWAIDMAGALPPLLLQQLRRFGIAEPPPELPPEPAPVSQAMVVVQEVQQPAATAVEEAWVDEP